MFFYCQVLGRPSLLWKHISIHFRHMVSSFDIFHPMVAMWFPFEPGHSLQVAAFRHADHFGSTEAGGRKAQLGWSWFHGVRYNSSQTKLVIWGLDGGLEVSLSAFGPLRPDQFWHITEAWGGEHGQCGHVARCSKHDKTITRPRFTNNAYEITIGKTTNLTSVCEASGLLIKRTLSWPAIFGRCFPTICSDKLKLKLNMLPEGQHLDMSFCYWNMALVFYSRVPH